MFFYKDYFWVKFRIKDCECFIRFVIMVMYKKVVFWYYECYIIVVWFIVLLRIFMNVFGSFMVSK